LDQEAIKVQPLPKICFSDDMPNIGTGTKDINDGRAVDHLDRDLSEVLMFGCDGVEGHNNPLGAE
jgi:hypothetical protein